MWLKVRDLVTPVTRTRVDGVKSVRYKLLDIEGIQIDPKWKVLTVSVDYDAGNTIRGVFYLTEDELDYFVQRGAEVKKIPVDPAHKKDGIPLPKGE